MESDMPMNQNETWTDEKHVHFLNSIEAWFVRTMLENNDRYHLRLDRYLPDSCESTLDCKRNIQPRKKHATSAFNGTRSRTRMKGRPDKRSRRPPPPSQLYDSSNDQVVPQIENKTEVRDENDLPTS